MDAKDYDHEKLQKIRRMNFTQENVASKLGVSVKTISRAETGKVASFKLLSAITKECGVSVKDILRENCLQNAA